MGRLVEVLAGRPLYVVAAELAQQAAANEEPIRLTPFDAEFDSALDSEQSPARTIDLTDRALSGQPAVPDPGESDEVAGSTLADVFGVAGAAARRASSGQGSPAHAHGLPAPVDLASRRWKVALTQASLPAASVVLLLALGGGVSAMVTGNPMAPMEGVSRVMSQLPGVDNSPSKSHLAQVEAEIQQADIAAARNDPAGAHQHLLAAQRGLAGLPADQRGRLTLMIASVATKITAPGVPGMPGKSPVGVEMTTPPATATPTPSTAPAGTPTVPVPSVEPTQEQEPTTVPTTPESVPTTTTASEPTVATTSTSP
jgi:hypothetical protein